MLFFSGRQQEDLYYIKTGKVFGSVEFEYKGFKFFFDAKEVEGKRGEEMRREKCFSVFTR